LDAAAHGEFRGYLHLLPHVDGRQRLAELICGADAFVHPNHREPFGIAPLEAMACAVPVVLPALGGVLEYAHTGNSWLAEPHPVHFADAIRAALDGTEVRERRLLAARQTAQAHDWSVVTERFFQQYESFHQRALAQPDPWPVPLKLLRWPYQLDRSSPPRIHKPGAGHGGKAA
jgi:glycosyltransferase involved in cell wall biosynthesis